MTPTDQDSEDSPRKRTGDMFALECESIEAITRRLDDVKAGRMRPWREVKRDLLRRKPHLADQ